MSQPDLALSPARHAPAILGCAAVLIAAGAGLGAALSLSPRSPDAAVLDALAAAPRAVAAPATVTAPAPALIASAAPLQPAVPAAAEPAPAAYIAAGGLDGSFYDSAVAAGAAPEQVREAVNLFAKKLDFARDLQPGEPFRLVFDPSVAGRAPGALLYAEIGAGAAAVRFYRFEHDGRVDYLDAAGGESRPLLLRTPVEGARITSGFGMRLHPVLGFNRLHPGVDFGAPQGSPVVAAGDGVVEEAQWSGGYGHWLKIGHQGGFETGYGHLSRYARGVKPGVHVSQGQVVAFVGSSGLSTGPHLHFEIMRDGRKLDPARAAVPVSRALGRAEAIAFAAQKNSIDSLLASPGAVRSASLALRPALAPQTGRRAG